MTIILFADLHGKVLLPFKMVEAWQKQYGEKADLILQCGDIGAFPDTKNMDKATLRFAKKNLQELGFSSDFVYQSFQKEDKVITFMGIGRIGNHSCKTGKRYIQEYEKRNIEEAIRENKRPDLLISHDVYCEMTTPGFGMEELRPVLNTLKPFAHFYGHTGQPYKVETDPNKK